MYGRHKKRKLLDSTNSFQIKINMREILNPNNNLILLSVNF